MKTREYKQQLYQSMLTGTLLYSVVLGFFNDYTHILHTTSYSTAFSLAIVMQLLTMATFWLKDVAVGRLKFNKALMAFGVWFIMFSSKFVFLGVIAAIFKDDVQLSGFIGLMAIIIVLTITQKVIELIEKRLA